MVKQETYEQNLQRAMRWMQDQATSGLTKEEWCKRNGIQSSRFFKWQKTIRETAMIRNTDESADVSNMTEQAPVFVEIPVAKSTSPTVLSSSHMTDTAVIISCGDFSIEVRNGVDETLLYTVLRAVKNVN